MSNPHWHTNGSAEPITYVRGLPIDLTTLITALHVLTTIICAVALAMHQGGVLEQQLLFSTTTFWQGKFWTILTDPFFHNIAQEHVWLALNLFFFFRFGSEIERLIGRWNFGFLYLALLAVPAMVCLLAAPLIGIPLGVRVPYLFTTAHFSILIGFTYIYPNAQFFFGITARWLASILISIHILAIVALPFFASLIPFFASLATVLLFLKFVGAGGGLDWLDALQNWKEKKQVETVKKHRLIQVEKRREEVDSVDAILDKISSHGLKSLTDKERAYLEKERQLLRAKEEKEKR